MALQPSAARPADVYGQKIAATGGCPASQPLGLLLRRTFERLLQVMTEALRGHAMELQPVRA